ncbi:hypothetical protein ASE14_15975 [Agromyces sp. Root81]|uniref:DUF4432 family protein n=1 Tax=Agromyces sp. Root81 TaxID=1736601 RepID=UPI0006FC51CE|nr:DUF4432 family protein [Agromyces sp. Root81]KRC59259.1 hypothetical protein ASE14_15975 [Agromyces sp. Root81]
MAITLTNDALEVRVAPERGADIVQLIDRTTGTPVLAESPTGRVTSTGPFTGDSMANWLNGYPGGWQLLAPNAGPEREHDGVRQGFHGEAALARWTVLERDAASCELETSLLTAPLHLHRKVALDGAELSVVDTITNLSPDPTSTRLVQHPAFGSPFLDGDSFLVASAHTLLTDADAPGTLAPADASGPPDSLIAAGPMPRSIRLPAPGSGASLFAALTDFESPEATFYSPNRGFGIRVAWDARVFPHAWLWMEANAGSGWPWFRRLYAIAVEPANVLPGAGAVDGRLRGTSGVEILPGEHITTSTTLTRLALPALN